MSRASEKALDALHATLAETLTDLIKDGKSKGEIASGLLSVARQFLKDNGVDAPAAAERFDDLATQLANIDLDDEAAKRLN